MLENLELRESLEQEARRRLSVAKRVVVKVGTRVLTDAKGKPNIEALRHLVGQIAKLHLSGKEILLVSSGSIACGLDVLNLAKRPKELPGVQMAAAVGQVKLMSMYHDSFLEENLSVAQILLTHDDFKNQTRNLNAKNTLECLFEKRVVPVVNENDVVAVDEIKVGDNDTLAALSAKLIEADALVLLSAVDGFLMPNEQKQSEVVSYLEQVDENMMQYAGESESAISTGGMNTKLQAAQLFADLSKLSVIANGRERDVLLRLFDKERVGTVVGRVL